MSRAIIVVGRLPRPGKVKTRLISGLGETGATAIYRAMLGDVLAIAARAAAKLGARAIFAVDGAPEDAAVLAPGFEILLQQGGDLGARLVDVVIQSRAERVVLIGTDAPALSATRIEAALEALAEHDAVMIPALDGGYVLLGINGARPALFTAIPWSTAGVAAATVAAAKAEGLDLCPLLPAVSDVDEVGDLRPVLEVIDPGTATAWAIRRALGIAEC